MTTCIGCGCCCDPVILPNTQMEYMRAKGLSRRTKQWIMEDLSPMPAKEARAKGAWVFESRAKALGRVDSTLPNFYRCRHFDPEQRICMDYENRPDPCRNFPWGKGPVMPNVGLPPMCSFRADQGKPVEPMPQEWQNVVLSRKR